MDKIRNHLCTMEERTPAPSCPTTSQSGSRSSILPVDTISPSSSNYPSFPEAFSSSSSYTYWSTHPPPVYSSMPPPSRSPIVSLHSSCSGIGQYGNRAPLSGQTDRSCNAPQECSSETDSFAHPDVTETVLENGSPSLSHRETLPSIGMPFDYSPLWVQPPTFMNDPLQHQGFFSSQPEPWQSFSDYADPWSYNRRFISNESSLSHVLPHASRFVDQLGHFQAQRQMYHPMRTEPTWSLSRPEDQQMKFSYDHHNNSLHPLPHSDNNNSDILIDSDYSSSDINVGDFSANSPSLANIDLESFDLEDDPSASETAEIPRKLYQVVNDDNAKEINLEVIQYPDNDDSSNDSSPDHTPSRSRGLQKDKSYTTSFKLESLCRMGVRTRRMAALESGQFENDDDFSNVEQRRRRGNEKNKRPETIRRRRGKATNMSFTTSWDRGKSKRSKTVREILEEKRLLRENASRQNDQEIMPPPSTSANTSSNSVIKSRNNNFILSDVIIQDSRSWWDNRPRHFIFERLQIGKFEVSHKKAKGRKNPNKLKILFSKRQLVYEFEHPLRDLDKKSASIVVPFSSLAALRCTERQLEVGVAVQPRGYLGSRRRGYEQTVDVTCGQLTICPVHKLTWEQENPHLKMQMCKIDPTFHKLFHQPMPESAPLAEPNMECKPLRRGGGNPGDALLIAQASLVCSCRISCRSIRCSCNKSRRKCNTGRALCFCTDCDNPLNILEQAGMVLSIACQDLCLLRNVYQVPHLNVYLNGQVRAECCGALHRLSAVVPGVVRCSNCGEHIHFSWCHERLLASRQAPPSHCPVCHRCPIPSQRHCPHCHQRFLVGCLGQPNPDNCPSCGRHLQPVQLEQFLTPQLILQTSALDILAASASTYLRSVPSHTVTSAMLSASSSFMLSDSISEVLVSSPSPSSTQDSLLPAITDGSPDNDETDKAMRSDDPTQITTPLTLSTPQTTKLEQSSPDQSPSPSDN